MRHNTSPSQMTRASPARTMTMHNRAAMTPPISSSLARENHRRGVRGMYSQEKHPMSTGTRNRLQAFASLHWYDETIKFVFNFVTKTSELLLAAGVVISTANFLTDGDVMSHNKALSDAWSWAQALAIDSSLGIVFMNTFQALRERERVKASIFFL